MATYTKTTDFLAKDSLPLNNAAKYVKGSEIDTEFDNIATADADNMKKSVMGTGVETFLQVPSSANLASCVTDETGSGALVFATSPTLVTPALGTPASGTLTNCTGLPQAGTVGLTTASTPQFAGIEIGHASDTTLSRVSPGVAAIEGSNILLASGLGSITQAYDADTLKADVSDDLTVGYTVTSYNAGTKSTGTFTPSPALGNFQYAVNGGPHTLAAPTSDCSMVIQYTNNGSAGAVTVIGQFTKITGDALTTTNGDDFLLYITKINGFSHLNIQALQ